ncbi:hypothetical protein [Saccharopolyspora sp. NPDC002686]|uniref:hypothetical protein n=1 Tax=Saccharopolyspora sp. NPDC002686 TaxID=3154541 RepID=UPI00331C3F2C
MTRRDALSGQDGTQALSPLHHFPDALTSAHAAPPTRESVAPSAPAPEPVEELDRPLRRRPAHQAPAQQQPPQKKQQQKKNSKAGAIGCYLFLAFAVLMILLSVFG